MAEKLTKKKYEESEKVKNAFSNYTNFKETGKPQEYTFSDSQKLKETEDSLFNYEKFSYDHTSDPVYNSYKDSYMKQGKKAMEDTVGNASALTGGYGNSYATTAGATAYNSHLDKLNDVVPQLYSAAYERYRDEFDRLESKLGYLTDKNKEEYSRYLDSYSAYSKEVDALRDLYLSEYANDMEIQESEWDSAYKIAMAEQERELRNAEIGYKYYAANLSQSQFEANLAAKQAQFEANLAAEKEQFKKQLEYNTDRSEKEDLLKHYELMLERKKIENADDQFWAEFNDSNKKSLRDDEISLLFSYGDEYDILAALDYQYGDPVAVRTKALVMGVKEEYIDAYFAAK